MVASDADSIRVRGTSCDGRETRPVEFDGRVGALSEPDATGLDGPVLGVRQGARCEGASRGFGVDTRPKRAGLTICPDVTFESAPALDVLCVPGGPGVDAMMEDDAVLQFVRERARSARFVTSVCTGALVLGAAGLLKGYRATTHWLSQDLLRLFGAEPVEDRVVIDRNRITGAGVTAGIDFGLAVAAEVCGPGIAQEIQLMLQYSPAPPFSSGTPGTAPDSIVRKVLAARGELNRGAGRSRNAPRRGSGSRSSRRRGGPAGRRRPGSGRYQGSSQAPCAPANTGSPARCPPRAPRIRRPSASRAIGPDPA